MNKDIKLEYIHLCDFASPAVGGKINLMGIFESFFAKKIPSFYVVVKFVAEEKIDYKVSFEIESEKKKKIFTDTAPVVIKKQDKVKFQIIKHMQDVNFEEFGNFNLIMYVNEIPLVVQKMEVKELITA